MGLQRRGQVEETLSLSCLQTVACDWLLEGGKQEGI